MRTQTISPLPMRYSGVIAAPPSSAYSFERRPHVRATISPEFNLYARQLPRQVRSSSDVAGFRSMMSDNGPGWASADGAYSIDLEDGRTLWTYGDTLINTIAADGQIIPNGGVVRNSAMLQNGRTVSTITTGSAAAPGDFLKPRDPAQWYWPGHGQVEGNSVVLFMARYLKPGAPSGWDFAFAGSDLAVLDRDTLAVQAQRELPIPTNRNVAWGAYLVDDGAHTYIFGMEDGTGPGNRWAVLARAPLNQTATAPWEYWDGSTWQDDVNATARMAQGVSNQYSVVPTQYGFAMLSQETTFGTTLNVAVARQPQGPWSAWRLIDPGPQIDPLQISYNATAHPHYRGKDLLVGWSMNLRAATLPTPAENPLYQPQFRAIDRQLLEPQ